MHSKHEKRYLEALKSLVLKETKNSNVQVFLFGSRAKGKGRIHSDVDIAIMPIEPLPPTFISQLKEKNECLQ